MRDVIPRYWATAKRSLARSDPVLGGIIRAHPRVALVSRGDPFQTLARSIVGQQISVRAADSVWRRLCENVGTVEPAAALRVGAKRLLRCGLSQRKAEYVIDLARHFATGRLDVRRWRVLDDEAIIAQLTEVRGIGRWTAEMFLIFNMLRPDVLPVADLGLQRAVSTRYFSGRPVRAKQLLRLGNTWSPWRSVATWYLWRSLDPVPVEY